MRVLHAPNNVANQAALMARGLRALGHHAETWQYGDTVYGFPNDRIIDRDGAPAVYVRALLDALDGGFDVVHFHFAQSLMPAHHEMPWYWDLPVLRSAGITIVFTFHGSDVRLRSHHLADDEWSFYRFGDVPCDEARIASQLSIIRRYAHAMTVVSVLDKPYVPEAIYIPKLVDCTELPMVGPANRDRPVILHAPSRRATKGTDLILEGLRELERRGLDFEVDLVEGASHRDLLERLAAADIVIEKVLGGDAGVASLEAMAMGKVAVARIRPDVHAEHPGIPVVSTDAPGLADALEELIGDADRRARIGELGREYVAATHDCGVVAAKLVELYETGRTAAARLYPGWTTPAADQRLDECLQEVEQLRSTVADLRNHVVKLRRIERASVSRRRSIVRWVRDRSRRVAGRSRPFGRRGSGSDDR